NFNYSGGFVARPTSLVTGDGVVKYNDWLRRTVTDDSPDVTTPRGQFLRAPNKTLNRGGLTSNAYFSRFLQLSNDRDDGLRLGGSGNNAVTYFTTDRLTGYAGIFDSTNLGAPLPLNSPGVTWQGIFGIAVGSIDYKDVFTLTINTNATGGTISGTVNVSGLGSTITMTENFDERGVIYSGTASGRPFSGLIGEEGAVGAFIDINNHIAGGFVAHKTTTLINDRIVRYNDWRRETETATVPDTSNVRSQFLETSGITINNGDAVIVSSIRRLTLSNRRTTDNVRLTTAGGSSNDGLAYFAGAVTTHQTGFSSITRTRGYAGIYSSTNLGTPLPVTPTASWKGIFGLEFGNVDYRNDFNLMVTSTGTGGTISATVNNNARFSNIQISGSFDAHGVMNASISSNALGHTTLSGLIGSQGAVGVFYANTAGLAGGFVAAPAATNSAPAQPRFGSVLPANADYTAWRDSFTSAPANLDTANRRNQLL
nr:hypothetical protein [Pseudomonadota bacterium]